MVPRLGTVFLSYTYKQTLESIQKSSIDVVLTEFNYDEALALDLPKLNKFLFDISECHFSKIWSNVHRPLYDRIIFNKDKFSSRWKYFSDLLNAAKLKATQVFSMTLLYMGTTIYLFTIIFKCLTALEAYSFVTDL